MHYQVSTKKLISFSLASIDFRPSPGGEGGDVVIPCPRGQPPPPHPVPLWLLLLRADVHWVEPAAYRKVPAHGAHQAGLQVSSVIFLTNVI